MAFFKYISNLDCYDELDDYFSYEAFNIICNILKVNDNDIEFDPVAIQNKYTEYFSAAEALYDYDPDLVDKYMEKYGDDGEEENEFQNACLDILKVVFEVFKLNNGNILIYK